VNTVESKPELIHRVSGEDVCFVDGCDLSASTASVSEPRNAVALESGFLAKVALDCVVNMQSIILTEVVRDVPGPLIQVDGGSGGADEPGSRGVVGVGKQCPQTLNGRVGDGSTLRSRWYTAVDRESLALAQSFVAKEEEGVVLPNRPAKVNAKLVAFEP
jgi:hypothetical protein